MAAKRLTTIEAELLSQKFRLMAGMGMTEPFNAKAVLRQFRIVTMFRPMSGKCFGISVKTGKNMFMLVNSNSTIGRQHFTIAHELYHLFYDDNPVPHLCDESPSPVERDANLFASTLLMPREGLLREISEQEVRSHSLKMATLLRLEQLFEVSRMALLIRLKDMGVISESNLQELSTPGAKETAREYGYDTSLYESGNENVVIGDFGEKAKRLFDEGRISEGHYIELLNIIGHGQED